MNNELVTKYTQLCAILGDLILNKEATEKRILEVRAQIEALNREAQKQAQKQEPKSEG